MAYDRRDGHGDGHCCMIESEKHVIDVMAIVTDIVIGFKL